MEDVITDLPPPSRFFPDDLDNFAAPSPPLPPPFLLFSDKNPRLSPSTLVIAASPLSRSLLHHLSPKTLIGALFLPELPLAANSLQPSPRDSGCAIYVAGGGDAVLVSFHYPVAPERARSAAKALVGGISPGKVLVLDSVRGGGFRGRLPADEALAFKLETAEQRAAGEYGPALRSVPYFPTGSVADGLGAAVLAECQMRKLPGTLCVTWPEAAGGGPAAVSLLEAVLWDFLPPGLELEADGGIRVTAVDSDLYV